MLEAALAGLAGLLIGSFLNVCIYRLPNDYSIVRPRSFCPACRLPIGAYDNIPVVSYILLGGRCRHCRGRIPIRYPLVEAITGALFFTFVYLHGANSGAARLCVFAALLVGLIVMDLEERVLPDEFTMGGVVFGLSFAAIAPMTTGLAAFVAPPEWGARRISLLESALGAAFPALVLWSVGRLYMRVRGREGLGGGDPRMVAMIGAFLGIHGALATILLGSILGSFLGLGYILLTRKDASRYELPFGTFLGVAALVIALLQPPGA